MSSSPPSAPLAAGGGAGMGEEDAGAQASNGAAANNALDEGSMDKSTAETPTHHDVSKSPPSHHDDPGESDSVERERREGMVPYRLLVPSESVGFIVGSKGAVVRQIKEQSGADILVLEREVQARIIAQHHALGTVSPHQEKVVRITGSTQQKERALALVLKRLKQLGRRELSHSSTPHTLTVPSDSADSTRYGRGDSSTLVLDSLQDLHLEEEDGAHASTFYFVVPDAACSAIIGVRGATIKSISVEACADIQIARDLFGVSDRRISVTGRIPAVVAAMTAVNNILADLLAGGRITREDLNPTKFPSVSPVSVSSGMRQVTPPSYPGIQMGMGGHPSSQPAGPGPLPNGFLSAAGGAGQPPTPIVAAHPLASGNIVATRLHPSWKSNVIAKLVVTKEETGWIVGKQGAHIKQVRSESTATVEIGDGPVPPCDPGDKVIDVMGTWQAMSKALHMLCQCLETRNSPTPTLRLLLPSMVFPHLIGRSGSQVQSIQRLSGASIQKGEQRESSTDERILTITGPPLARAKACQIVYEMLQERSIDEGSGIVTSPSPPPGPAMAGQLHPAMLQGAYGAGGGVGGAAGDAAAFSQIQPDHFMLMANSISGLSRGNPPLSMRPTTMHVLFPWNGASALWAPHPSDPAAASTVGPPTTTLAYIMSRTGAELTVNRQPVIGGGSGGSFAVVSIRGTAFSNAMAFLLLQEKYLELSS